MELSCQLEKLGARLMMEWSPREPNEEPDRFSNGDCISFSERNRIHLKMDNANWIILDRMLSLGAEFVGDIVRTALAEAQAPKRRTLRETEPW